MKISQVKGVIFDVDDTLLDNAPESVAITLHEQSRLAAAHQVGKRHNIQALCDYTPEQCLAMAHDAKIHSLEGISWQTLYALNIVPSQDIDKGHPLLLELIQLKDEMHEVILREHGKEITGATAFIESLCAHGLADTLAIASTACRRDIDVFFEMTGLDRFFPEKRIFSREKFTHAKPDPEPFNLAFASLGLPQTDRGSVIAFEDDYRGIASAKGAGLYVIGITTRYTPAQMQALDTPPDAIINSYAEAAALLELPQLQVLRKTA